MLVVPLAYAVRERFGTLMSIYYWLNIAIFWSALLGDRISGVRDRCFERAWSRGAT